MARSAIVSRLALVDSFLRGAGAFYAPSVSRQRGRWMLALILVFAPLYGACMGSFPCTSPERALQLLFAAVKTPLLLLATTALCVPAFFVLNTLFGLREDFVAALQAILSGQAAVSIALAALAPLTVLWYASVDSYRAALLFNAGVFAAAAFAGQIVTRREYAALIARRPAHRRMLIGWIVLYAFVGIQMGWTLRPFLGAPEEPPSVFRQEPFSNAYVVVLRLVIGG